MASVTEQGRTGGDREGELSLEDCRCPVCLEIFMEPVTLPCTHTFCKACFLEAVDKAALCCPLCRKRVSTWARRHSRAGSMVDQMLWTRIQTLFPLHCQRRLSGQEATISDNDQQVFFPRVSQPGELRQEYEDQVTRLTEEKEEQQRASELYIQRLLAEDEEVQQEERRRKEEDEKMARQLSSQLNSSSVSQEMLHPVITAAKKIKKNDVIGRIETFFSPRSPSSSGLNKNNMLVPDQPPHHLDHLPPEGSGGSLSSKRKNSETLEKEQQQEARQGEEGLTKRPCSFLEGGVLALQGLGVLEVELMRRQRQEEEDRRLAVLLQKELDQEEKRRSTDRRKGSTDAYLLRQGGRSRETTSPAQASARKTKTSSSSSSRRSKQVTIPQMFPPMS